MRIKFIYFILLFLFLCFLINANENSFNNAVNKITAGFDFTLTSMKDNLQSQPSDIERYETSAKTVSSKTSTGLIIGGVISLLFGVAGVGAGVPMWYYAGIGLGFIKIHPGIVEVRPIDGNYMWLWLSYSFGITFIILGSALFIAGIAMIVSGVLTGPSSRRNRVSIFYKNDFELNTACSSMGVNIKL